MGGLKSYMRVSLSMWCPLQPACAREVLLESNSLPSRQPNCVILLQVSCCGCPPPAAIPALTGEGRVRQGLVVSSEPSLAPDAPWIEEKEEKKEKKGAAAQGH